ncbi:MAG: TIGR03905 family TSCPD domain-containing protein [Clostridium sp.]|uniref:TIGR03905 family TSCPD domain-containing protein n=1 Tax=Clostridium sp. TaxID=1506 RepID=UPI003F409C93
MYTYKTSGVCSTEIHIDVKDNIINSVEFVRGCPGNLFGISKLVEGMNVDEAIEKLAGIKCGNKETSCPDQLSKALIDIKNA